MASILIVEDSPDNMKLFTTLLRLKGHDITGILGGEELFASLRQRRPDLILMDIQMPGKDGFTLLAEVRESEFRDQRIVALTANAMAGDMEKALEAGFDGYISKPIDIRRFPDQVGRALAGENPITDD
ncbi:MAG: response regulator [Gemmatimonadales bacterium]